MAKLTFVGGIHPYDGKDLSKDKPIQDVLPKGEMVYPLSQHIGAPAKPIVAKGDRVLAGQKIAESGMLGQRKFLPYSEMSRTEWKLSGHFCNTAMSTTLQA